MLLSLAILSFGMATKRIVVLLAATFISVPLCYRHAFEQLKYSIEADRVAIEIYVGMVVPIPIMVMFYLAGLWLKGRL